MSKRIKPKVFTEYAMYSFATFYVANYHKKSSYEMLLSEWLKGEKMKDITPTKRILKTILKQKAVKE